MISNFVYVMISSSEKKKIYFKMVQPNYQMKKWIYSLIREQTSSHTYPFTPGNLMLLHSETILVNRVNL